eukprot:g5376.t1
MDTYSRYASSDVFNMDLDQIKSVGHSLVAIQSRVNDTVSKFHETMGDNDGLGDLRYKPNLKRPPLESCKDLLWLQNRELSSHKTMQAINMWEFLIRSYQMYCHEFKQRKHYKKIAMFLRKKRAMVNSIYTIRRNIILRQRKRIWEQTLDMLVALSNYANGKPINTNALKQNLSDRDNKNKNSRKDAIDFSAIANVNSSILPHRNLILQRIEAIVPLLPRKLFSLNMPKKVQTLFEFINFIVSDTKNNDELDANQKHVEPTVSHHRTNNMKHVERTLGTVTVQNTPYIQRKIAEYEQQNGIRSNTMSSLSTYNTLYENDEMEEEEEDETLYGFIRVPIVGIRYYRGVVHQGEWVDLVREPNNPYDRNAIRVDNQSGIQVGHIGRDFAYSLRPIMDGIGDYENVRIECTIPNAPNGVYRIGGLITVYGPENLKERLSSQIRRQVYRFQASSSGGNDGSSSVAVKKTVKKISPMKTQDELNKMFDKLEEETKIGDMLGSDNFDNRIKPLKSTLFPHQLFGVKWMIHRESIFHLLPPFWEEKIEKSKKVYYNGITASSTPNKPGNVVGGILADDMGLGKTIQTIALIVSNPPKSILSRGGYQQIKDEEEERGEINPYKKMKLKDLKSELKTRGINVKGKRGDIIAALDKIDASLPKTTLIICPTSVLATWLSQISQHVCDGYLNVLLYHGSNRNTNPDVLKNYDIILTSYGTVNHEFRSLTENGSSSSNNNNNGGMNGNKKRKHGASSSSSQGLFALNYHRVVLDEAHMIRNRNTKCHKAVLNLKSTNRWCLTGTPLQNKAEDMQSLFAFLKCKPINEFKVWKRSIGRLIKDGDELGLARLRVFVRSICLRRSKSLLVDKLPERTIELHSLEMDGQQKTIYDELFDSAKYVFAEVSKGGDGDNVFRNYSSVLELLLRLRQATCSPSMIKKERLNAAREILKNVVNGSNKKKLTKDEAETLFAKIKGVLAVEDDEEDHECAVCFEDLTGDNDLLRVLRACGHPFCKDCLKSIQQVQHSEIRCPLCRVPFQKQDIINPSLVKATIEADTLSSNGTSSSYSSNNLTTNDQEKVAEIPVKVRALLKEMQKVVAKGEKALVFSNFTSFLDVIASVLKTNGIFFGRIDGRMSPKKRLNAAKSFSNDKNVSCMLISTKAGGTGLNLIEANHVFIMDLWWNFSSEEQAMDRCYRIGQQKNVHVIRYCCKDSVEERILKIQERKQMLAKGSMQKQTPEERRQTRLDELTSMFQ